MVVSHGARRLTAAGLLLIPLAAAACSGSREASAHREGTERDLPVAAAAVARRDLARAVAVAGSVEPLRTIGVNSLAAGSVLALRVEEGDEVREGELLAELDARETRAQLERATALLASAEADFERSQQLHAGQIITAAEFEASRSAYEVAKSDAELWRTRLEFTRITAPSAGVVTAKHVEAGSVVSANQRVFDLADVSQLVVRVQLSELDVVYLRAGAAVDVSLDAYPTVQLPGRVRRVFPTADQDSRLVPVEVALGPVPPDVRVRPGFLARVTFALERQAGVLAVPAPAVGASDRGPFVYVVEADTLVRRPVALGLTAQGWVALERGVREGELVVVSGHTNLQEGARVRVIEPSPAPDARDGIGR
jgi:RND family efflux transporter MFP subunit